MPYSALSKDMAGKENISRRYCRKKASRARILHVIPYHRDHKIVLLGRCEKKSAAARGFHLYLRLVGARNKFLYGRVVRAEAVVHISAGREIGGDLHCRFNAVLSLDERLHSGNAVMAESKHGPEPERAPCGCAQGDRQVDESHYHQRDNAVQYRRADVILGLKGEDKYADQHRKHSAYDVQS